MLAATLLVLALLSFAAPARATVAVTLDRGTLRVVHTLDGGPLLVQVFTAQTVGVSENMSPPTFFSPVSDVELSLLDGSVASLEVEFLAPLEGSLSVWLGAGDRDLLLSGSAPEVGGDLSIWGGAGSQLVSVDASQPLTSGGDFLLANVNGFASPGVPVVVGGDLDMVIDEESLPARFDVFYLDLEGDFRYRGSSEVDQVDLGFGDVDIRGKLTIELGDGITGSSDVQSVTLKSGVGPGSPSVAGLVSVSAGQSTNGDFVDVESDAALAKGIRLALGEGTNTANLRGTIGKIQYKGGSGMDEVTLGMNAPSAKLQLGDGNDLVFLRDTLALPKLAIDFGAANDEYYVEVGTDVPDGAKIKNLP